MKQGIFSSGQPGKQHGFVLAMTLWIMVIVAIAAGYFADRVTRSVELAQQSQQNTRAIIDMAGTRAEMLYRLGTTPLTEFGLGRGNASIALDNRPYHGLGSTLVRLQDNRGLLNLNIIDDGRLNIFLGLMGIPAEKRDRMIDTLHDYIDADKLRRLNGAEEEDYLAQNLRLPSNNRLITPWEARRIIGWRDEPQLWQNGRLADLVTTSISVGINPNTAPAEVLATLPGITEELAQKIITSRKQSPIGYATQLAELASIPAQQFGTQIVTLPADSIRITQSMQGLSWAIQYNITLTPNGKDAPWRTDYFSRVSTGQRNDAEAIELPPRSTAPPDQIPSFLLGG